MLKNGLILGMTFLQYMLMECPAATMFGFIMFRNALMCSGIEHFTRHRSYANQNYKEPRESYPGEFAVYLIQGSALELVTSVCIVQTGIGHYNHPSWMDIGYDIITFVPKSLLIEIVFDFFHYWAHRAMHVNATLYKLHRTHHKHHCVRPILAFYQNVVDLILSNSIPFMLAVLLSNAVGLTISPLQLVMLYNYKIFIEIAGHSNKTSYPTCSFPQCIWIPRCLGIELCSDDHNLHHSKVQCNYAKRFSLWDKVFGTWTAPVYYRTK